jgi:hypothetical protein
MYGEGESPPRKGGKGGVGLVIDMGSLTDEPSDEEMGPESGEGGMPGEVYDLLGTALPDADDTQLEALYQAIKLCKE